MPGQSTNRRRLAPSYDLEGPRVRLGIAWCGVVFIALWVGRLAAGFPLIGLVYAAVAAVAAVQITDSWVYRPRSPVLRASAVAIAVIVGLSASFGARALGGALILGVAVAAVAALTQVVRHRNVLASMALVLQASLPVGMVAACVVLTTRYEIGAAVILLATVMAFDAGDFLIGSGAGSVIEGPIAGAIMVALVGAVAAIIGAPPFQGGLAWAFAAGAALLCPLGQIVASALLPDATTRAGALRRLDSLLVLAPAWAFGAGLVAAKA